VAQAIGALRKSASVSANDDRRSVSLFEFKPKEKRRQEAGPQRIGKKKKNRGIAQSNKLPQITPVSKCRLRLLR
jgi:hypothetical protein